MARSLLLTHTRVTTRQTTFDKPPRAHYTCGVTEWSTILLAGAAVFFIGVSKAGLGGGLGMLTTPVCVLAFGLAGQSPQFAVGFLLPLLCAGDAFSLRHYWGQWRLDNLKFLLPGVLLGVIAGVQLVGRLEPRHFSIIIGGLAVGFVIFQVLKEKVFKNGTPFVPGYGTGTAAGVGAGLTSTFAHGAGPMVNLFMIPQRLPKVEFTSTRVLIFTWINWIKMPFFIGWGLVTLETVKWSAAYLPLVPLGVALGVWLNRKIPEATFRVIILAATALAGVYLIITNLSP